MSRFFSHVEAGVVPTILLVGFVCAFIAYAVWVFWPTRKKTWEERGSIPLKDESGE